MKQQDDQPGRHLYSLEDASSALGGSSVWTIRRHIALGNIRATKLGKRVFINAAELARITSEGLPSLRGSQD